MPEYKTPEENTNPQLNNCTDDPQGIYFNPKIHKTPTQWVEYFEKKFEVEYKGRKPTIFGGWLSEGRVPKKFGGGKMELFIEIDSTTRLYKWVKP